jgi:hypothetical protein
LVASIFGLCGANWGGTYSGSNAGKHDIELQARGAGLSVRELRIGIDDGGSTCWLMIEDCQATLDPGGAGFSAGPCSAQLQGHQPGCFGSIDLDLRGDETAAGANVTSFTLQTSLNDWPVAMDRVPVYSCGLGVELLIVLPLLWLWRLAAPRRR